MTPELRREIREMYKKWAPRTDPYRYGDWDSIFSPIEKHAWYEIRFHGLPFYPQYPVLGYFLDFADPVKKIGIEMDGKEYHQDLAADSKRQKEIEAEGWRIIRIKSSAVYPIEDGEDLEEETGDYGVGISQEERYWAFQFCNWSLSEIMFAIKNDYQREAAESNKEQDE